MAITKVDKGIRNQKSPQLRKSYAKSLQPWYLTRLFGTRHDALVRLSESWTLPARKHLTALTYPSIRFCEDWLKLVSV